MREKPDLRLSWSGNMGRSFGRSFLSACDLLDLLPPIRSGSRRASFCLQMNSGCLSLRKKLVWANLVDLPIHLDHELSSCRFAQMRISFLGHGSRWINHEDRSRRVQLLSLPPAKALRLGEFWVWATCLSRARQKQYYLILPVSFATFA